MRTRQYGSYSVYLFQNILVQKTLQYSLLTLPIQAHSHPCLNKTISYRNHQKKEHQNVGSHYDTPILQQISVNILVTRDYLLRSIVKSKLK